jgi:hypothetical protein
MTVLVCADAEARDAVFAKVRAAVEKAPDRNRPSPVSVEEWEVYGIAT